jgi:hypothetical protein
VITAACASALSPEALRTRAGHKSSLQL